MTERNLTIIGASMCGLLVCHALRDHFSHITLIDRDALPSEPVQRKAIPQGHHSHILLQQGLHNLQALIPDIKVKLIQGGAVQANATLDFRTLFPQGWFPVFPSDIDFLSMTRPLLETVTRLATTTLPHVTIRDATEVVDITLSASASPVISIREKDQTETTTLNTDLLIDASGQGSRAAKWLEQNGFPSPQQHRVKAFIGYSSLLLSGLQLQDKAKGYIVMAREPEHPLGAVLLPVEQDRHMLTLFGFGRHYPATEPEAIRHQLRNLRSDIIYQALEQADFRGVKTYRKEQNYKRDFAASGAWPRGFLVIGDAVSSFNPIYGQGIASHSNAIMTLRRFAAGKDADDLIKTAKNSQRQIVRSYAEPWSVSCNEDLRWPETMADRPSPFATKFLHRFADRIGRAASRDAVVTRAYVKILHMAAKPRLLFRPDILIRILLKGGKKTHAE